MPACQLLHWHAAGLAAGARDDPSDGLAVRGALGERTVPHAASPETDNKSAKYP